MTKLLKVAGITASKKASGIKVDELGRIELSRTVEPKRIIGNVLEPYAEDYRGPVSVLGLELYAINSSYRTNQYMSHSQPTPDGWLMARSGRIIRYDSKGSVIWQGEWRSGGSGWTPMDGVPAIRGNHVYSVSRVDSPSRHFTIDKISYETGKVVQEGGSLGDTTFGNVNLVYAASIDRLVGLVAPAGVPQLVYIHPETLAIEFSSGGSFSDKLTSVFGAGAKGAIRVLYERGVIYILADNKGVASARIGVSVDETVQRLTKLFDITTVNSAGGVVLNGDVYSEAYQKQKQIMRNGKVIYTRETPKTADIFLGGTSGNLALMADGNKVLAFDKDNLVMSVEIPHEIEISNIAGDSMGNIFVGTTGGIYILGDTLQIKGYQLVL